MIFDTKQLPLVLDIGDGAEVIADKLFFTSGNSQNMAGQG